MRGESFKENVSKFIREEIHSPNQRQQEQMMTRVAFGQRPISKNVNKNKLLEFHFKGLFRTIAKGQKMRLKEGLRNTYWVCFDVTALKNHI